MARLVLRTALLATVVGGSTTVAFLGHGLAPVRPPQRSARALCSPAVMQKKSAGGWKWVRGVAT